MLAASVGDPALRAALDQIVAAGPQATCVSVSVDGRQVYSHQPDLPVPPASNQKLVTAAVALEDPGRRPPLPHLGRRCGAEARHRERRSLPRRWRRPGAVDEGLHRPLPRPAPVGTSLEKLADAVVAAGVHHVTGRILGDESRYDTLRTVPTWPDALRGQHQTGPLSALTVNDGFTSFPEHETEQNRLEVEATTDPAGYAASTFTQLLASAGCRSTAARPRVARPRGHTRWRTSTHPGSAPSSARCSPRATTRPPSCW